MRWILSAGLILIVVAMASSLGEAGVTPAGVSGSGTLAWRPGTARLSQAELNASPTAIDRLVLAGLKRNGVAPNPLLDDLGFLRRLSLALIGRIPDIGMHAEFAELNGADRREVMIERLLAHPGHGLHRFGFYADLFRVQSQSQNRYNTQGYVAWLRDEAAANRPWDVLVRRLLTASGAAYAAGNAATGFWLRDAGMPLDRVSHEVQVFMGTRIGCAQCHDHPFDSWSRRQFYEIAAHTANTKVEGRRLGVANATMNSVRMAFEKESQEVRNVGRNLGTLLNTSVHASSVSTIALPDDYQYADGKPNQRVPATAMWGGALPPAMPGDARAAWAAWITAQDNPRFAAVIANRMWFQLFGYALVTPIDGWTDATVPSDPELLDLLARIMVSVGYDLNRFERILCRTEAFRRVAVTSATAARSDGHQPGPVIKRLSAEQVWDSVMALSQADPEAAPSDDIAGKIEAYVAKHMADRPEDIVAEARRLVELRNTANKLVAEQRKPATSKERQEEIAKELAELRVYGEIVRGPRGANQAVELRAAYLAQPAPASHPLRILGQSDRDLIDNADTRPNVTQALLVMNGLADRYVVNRKTSRLMAHLYGLPGNDERITAAYLQVLGRQATPDERERCRAYLSTDPVNGLGDVVWSLIASTEFMFRN